MNVEFNTTKFSYSLSHTHFYFFFVFNSFCNRMIVSRSAIRCVSLRTSRIFLEYSNALIVWFRFDFSESTHTTKHVLALPPIQSWRQFVKRSFLYGIKVLETSFLESASVILVKARRFDLELSNDKSSL